MTVVYADPLENSIAVWAISEAKACKRMGLSKRETKKAVKVAMGEFMKTAVKEAELVYGM